MYSPDKGATMATMANIDMYLRIHCDRGNFNDDWVLILRGRVGRLINFKHLRNLDWIDCAGTVARGDAVYLEYKLGLVLVLLWDILWLWLMGFYESFKYLVRTRIWIYIDLFIF